MNRTIGTTRPHHSHIARAYLEPLMRQPWLLCAAALMVALLSTYVHVLNGQVERGERLRQTLAQAAKGGAGTPTQLLAELAEVVPMSPVGPDTGR